MAAVTTPGSCIDARAKTHARAWSAITREPRDRRGWDRRRQGARPLRRLIDADLQYQPEDVSAPPPRDCCTPSVDIVQGFAAPSGASATALLLSRGPQHAPQHAFGMRAARQQVGLRHRASARCRGHAAPTAAATTTGRPSSWSPPMPRATSYARSRPSSRRAASGRVFLDELPLRLIVRVFRRPRARRFVRVPPRPKRGEPASPTSCGEHPPTRADAALSWLRG